MRLCGSPGTLAEIPTCYATVSVGTPNHPLDEKLKPNSSLPDSSEMFLRTGSLGFMNALSLLH